MATLCTALRSRQRAGEQTAELDRSPYLRARSIEKVEDELLDFASRIVLSDTRAIVLTEA